MSSRPSGATPDLKRKEYERELQKLHIELCELQRHAKETGLRAVIVFEGRDAAGKGGVIKAMTARVSPRVFRVVALPAPSDKEKTQFYIQRYLEHFPGAGEIVIFDRSWYNRAGVERVMGFCSEEEVERFYAEIPAFEKAVVDSGIHLVKYWMEVGQAEQTARFSDRLTDPRKHWKLSGIDIEAHRRWYAYSRARDEMFERTDTDVAPWHVVRSDLKRRARLNCISHLLDTLPYERVPFQAPELPARDTLNAYDDDAQLQYVATVPEKF